MQYPGPPCQHKGQYCWQDPIGKTHYRLRTHHLKTIIKYVEQGGILDTHNNVPNNVREQLYAEECQRLSKQNKSPNNLTTASTIPLININVLPTQSSQSLISSSGTEATSTSNQADYVGIPGLLEAVVEEYAIWHLSRVNSDCYKENIMKARNIALDNWLDLGHIRAESPDFFVRQGVKIGVARRFVSHTRLWLEGEWFCLIYIKALQSLDREVPVISIYNSRTVTLKWYAYTCMNLLDVSGCVVLVINSIELRKGTNYSRVMNIAL